MTDVSNRGPRGQLENTHVGDFPDRAVCATEPELGIRVLVWLSIPTLDCNTAGQRQSLGAMAGHREKRPDLRVFQPVVWRWAGRERSHAEGAG